MNQVYCPNCGALNAADHRFCLRCGTALAEAKPVTPPPRDAKIGVRLRPELLVVGGIAIFIILSVCIVGFVILVTQTGSSEEAAPEVTTEPPPSAATDEPSADVSNALLSQVDLYSLTIIAQEFSDPRLRQVVDPNISAADLLNTPQDFAGQTVTITGQLIQKTVVYNLIYQNWPRAYFLIVESGEANIPVAYQGYVGHLKLGDTVQVRGAFSAAGAGIRADQVSRPEQARSPLQSQPRILILAATIANTVWALFCITIFLWRARRVWAIRRVRRGSGGPPIVAMLIALLLSGCTIEIATTVNPDGSGTVGVDFADTRENIDFLRQVPGLNDYFDAWQASMRRQGVLVDDSFVANQEQIHLQSVFGSINDLAQAAPGTSVERSWVYAEISTEGTDRVFRYSALVDTTALYEPAPGVDPNVISQSRSQLDATKISYAVTLPGQIVFQNATRAIGNQLIWDIRMNDRNEIKAESRLVEPPQEDWTPLIWIAQVIVFVTFTVLLPLSLLLHRVRKT